MRRPRAWDELFDIDIKPKFIEAKKVLPVSPINIFAGLQFHIIKAKSELKVIRYGWPNFKTKQAAIIEINNDPPTIPSIPSIKFIKFMIAVKKNIIEIKAIKFK